jgi:hypothetical protein
MIDVEAEVATYTYKPGVTLSVHPTTTLVEAPVQTEPTGFQWTLRVAGEVLDSQDPTSRNLTKAEFPIPDDQLSDADTFAFFVRLCIIFWETHEVDEWFRRGNARAFTPSTHGPNALSSMRTDIYGRLNRSMVRPPA